MNSQAQFTSVSMTISVNFNNTTLPGILSMLELGINFVEPLLTYCNPDSLFQNVTISVCVCLFIGFPFLSCWTRSIFTALKTYMSADHLAPPTFQAWKLTLIEWFRISFLRKLYDVIIQQLTFPIWAKWCYQSFRDISPLYPHSTTEHYTHYRL